MCISYHVIKHFLGFWVKDVPGIVPTQTGGSIEKEAGLFFFGVNTGLQPDCDQTMFSALWSLVVLESNASIQ